MKVYYAHSKKVYDTPEEEEILKLLEDCFDEVICPNRDIGEKGAIGPYLDAIDQCDTVIATEYKDSIGRGVYDEIRHALKNDIDVFVLRKGELVAVIDVIMSDGNDWAVFYGKLLTNLYEALAIKKG